MTALDNTRSGTHYHPRPGYYEGILRLGVIDRWSCGHRHEIKQQAQDCADRELARRIAATSKED